MVGGERGVCGGVEAADAVAINAADGELEPPCGCIDESERAEVAGARAVAFMDEERVKKESLRDREETGEEACPLPARPLLLPALAAVTSPGSAACVNVCA